MLRTDFSRIEIEAFIELVFLKVSSSEHPITGNDITSGLVSFGGGCMAVKSAN